MGLTESYPGQHDSLFRAMAVVALLATAPVASAAQGEIDRESGEEHIIVRERVRTVSIVRHDGDRQTRPVVRITVCIAGRVLDTEASLIDRSEFSYPLLLGRNTLRDFVLVDASSTYLGTPDCPGLEKERSTGT